jgi:hypothetical protein
VRARIALNPHGCFGCVGCAEGRPWLLPDCPGGTVREGDPGDVDACGSGLGDGTGLGRADVLTERVEPTPARTVAAIPSAAAVVPGEAVSVGTTAAPLERGPVPLAASLGLGKPVECGWGDSPAGSATGGVSPGIGTPANTLTTTAASPNTSAAIKSRMPARVRVARRPDSSTNTATRRACLLTTATQPRTATSHRYFTPTQRNGQTHEIRLIRASSNDAVRQGLARHTGSYAITRTTASTRQHGDASSVESGLNWAAAQGTGPHVACASDLDGPLSVLFLPKPPGPF